MDWGHPHDLSLQLDPAHGNILLRQMLRPLGVFQEGHDPVQHPRGPTAADQGSKSEATETFFGWRCLVPKKLGDVNGIEWFMFVLNRFKPNNSLLFNGAHPEIETHYVR